MNLKLTENNDFLPYLIHLKLSTTHVAKKFIAKFRISKQYKFCGSLEV
jgi:hypothetical protein